MYKYLPILPALVIAAGGVFVVVALLKSFGVSDSVYIPPGFSHEVKLTEQKFDLEGKPITTVFVP